MQRTIFEAEHDDFRRSVSRFFQNEIGPHAEKWREQGYVDRWAYTKAGEQGYLVLWPTRNTALPASMTSASSRSSSKRTSATAISASTSICTPVWSRRI